MTDIFPDIIHQFLEHVIILNNKSEVVFISNGISHLLGYTAEEIKEHGLPYFFINPETRLETLYNKVDRFGECFFTDNIRHKTRTYINVVFRASQIEKDGELFYAIFIRDNTQQQIVRKDIIKKALTIENLSKSRKIREGKLDEAIYEILELSSRATNTTRVNAWVFDKDKTEIQCIGNFDARENKLVPQSALPRIAMPFYFSLFETEKIIITSDAFTETKTAELYEFYLKPHNIQALMDIPVRIEGEMIGVICFENVGSPREWTLQEQKFGLVTAQMISLALETYEKKKARQSLEISLNEQKVLLQEIHHRVKNNLSIVASLMNLQAEKSHDEYHRRLFEECKDRLNSIATVHELIYKAKSYAQLNFKEYLNEILDHLGHSYSASQHIKLVKGITDVHLDISSAIPLALIVNELITNAYKHAFNGRKDGVIEISLLENNKQVFLTIRDNGVGFDDSKIPAKSIGLDILNGLVDQIDGTCQRTNKPGEGTAYKISFSKK
ncbi:MAG: ATP-binding protein [Bacteroidetes bacterium]|nr:ATP-binding protein [Bacteroidota bacterium]